MLSNIFFEPFLNFLMSLNSLFSSPKRFHLSFSSSLDSSCFLFVCLFFFNSLFFSATSRRFFFFVFFFFFFFFFFSFFNSFFYLIFFDFIKIVNLDRFLFKNRGFISYYLIVLGVFLWENF